jgi:hypothetical protein
MKRFSAFLFLTLFLIGCSSFKVAVKEDPFKGTISVTTDMWHKVIDSKIDNRRVIYQKEIKNGKVMATTVGFEFYAVIANWGDYNYNGETLGNDVYVLCDNKSYKLNIVDANKVQQTEVYSSQSKGASGSTSSQVGSVNTCMLTGKITLTPEVQNAIQKCENYMIRFYIGNNTLTLKATPSQLETVKEFLLNNGTTK